MRRENAEDLEATADALEMIRLALEDQRAGIAHEPRDRVLRSAARLDRLTPLSARWLAGLLRAASRMSPRDPSAPARPLGLSAADLVAFDRAKRATLNGDRSEQQRPASRSRRGSQ